MKLKIVGCTNQKLFDMLFGEDSTKDMKETMNMTKDKLGVKILELFKNKQLLDESADVPHIQWSVLTREGGMLDAFYIGEDNMLYALYTNWTGDVIETEWEDVPYLDALRWYDNLTQVLNRHK